MLVLTRKLGESIVIDGSITIKVSQIQGNRVRLCVDAPRAHRVIRAEVQPEEQPVIAARGVRPDSAAVPLMSHAK